MKKTRTFVGQGSLGCLTVSVWINPNTYGGHCSSSGTPWAATIGPAECCIELGAADESFSELVTALLHEAFELHCILHGHRYDPSPSYSGSTDTYLFLMTHPEMSECFGAVAPLVTAILPKLAVLHKKWYPDAN